MMRGFIRHLLITLKLNFRNPQAVVFGYVVPLFFLFAYGSVFVNARDKEPLSRYLGQLLTITIMGGACFGLPIALVAERERWVWRRYRLTPMPVSAFVLSVLTARYLIVLSAGVLQIGLAMWIYRMPMPMNLMGLWLAFTLACFAFLGIGLVISMLANSTHAVQALGQSIFLPMIMIGGVGVPFSKLPKWVPHLASYFPGRYAVQAMDRCIYKVSTTSRHYSDFNLLALLVIGAVFTWASAMMFRWENGQTLKTRAYVWCGIALLTWVAAGLIAQWQNLT